MSSDESPLTNVLAFSQSPTPNSATYKLCLNLASPPDFHPIQDAIESNWAARNRDNVLVSDCASEWVSE